MQIRYNFWRNTWTLFGFFLLALAAIGYVGTNFFPSLFGPVTNATVIFGIVDTALGGTFIGRAIQQTK